MHGEFERFDQMALHYFISIYIHIYIYICVYLEAFEAGATAHTALAHPPD